MRRGINRRDLIKGSLATGAAVLLPGTALARAHRAAHGEHHASHHASHSGAGHHGAHHAAHGHAHHTAHATPHVTPVAESPSVVTAQASGFTPYQRRVVAIARREAERAGEALWHRDIVGVADFAQPSSQPRLHFVDLESGSLRSFLVAHGRGSDPEHDGWLKHFSNSVGSEATSRGAYVTGAMYDGKYGLSVRLSGLDADNSNAYDRAIVMHPAWYVGQDMLVKYGKLGRSEGCFAMAPENFGEALWHLAGGRLLYADRIGEA